ncbi:MAG: Hint domain-containing protein [Shimia sp.]
MAWCAIADRSGLWRDPSRVGPAWWGTGTLLIEAQVTRDDLPFAVAGGGVAIEIARDGRLRLQMPFAAEPLGALPHAQLGDLPETLRLSWSWDVASGAALLSLFHPAREALQTVVLPRPRPVPAAAFADLLVPGTASFQALSAGFEPVGPMPGLAGDLEVATSEGLRPCADLRGEVATFDGPRPILACISRTLPARGSLRPVRLCAPFFGLRHDRILSAETPILMQGDDIEYLFGTEAATATAGQLVDGRAARWADTGPRIAYHQVICDAPAILAAEIPVASLAMGEMAVDPVAASASLAAHLPEPVRHAAPPFPALRDYEVVTLAEMRAA